MYRSTSVGAILATSAVATFTMMIVVLESSPAGEAGAAREAVRSAGPPAVDELRNEVGEIEAVLDLAELRRFDDAPMRPVHIRPLEQCHP